MAIDNTPPRLKLIVTIAVITVITLVAIDFATKSYYAMMTDEAKHEKIAPTRDRDEQMKSEQTALTGAAMPVDQAMGQVAKGMRPEAISPQASEDVGPVTGWSKLPHPAPTVQHAVAGGADVPMIGDGGVMLYSDGGMMLGPDGGPMMAPAPLDAGAGDAGGGRDGGARRGRVPHGDQH
jgi:hypothetical protein